MDTFSMFLSLAGHGFGRSFNLTPGTILDIAVDPSTALAGITFLNTGGVLALSPSASVRLAATDWAIPNLADIGALFEVRYVSHTGDALTTEATAVNIWIDLSVGRTYSILSSGIGTESSVQTFEIRRISDSEVVASGQIDLSTNIEPGG